MNTTYGLTENKDNILTLIEQSTAAIRGLHEIMDILEKDQSQSTLKLKLYTKLLEICSKAGI